MSRETVLSLLLAHPGEYLSGAAMSRTLGVSRAAVWKAIEALRQEGYEITSAPNRGYRLESAPDRVREGELSGHLAGCLVGSRLLCLDTIDSTNTEAKRQAMAGAPEGLVVLAEEQTGGRGRLGRSFQSPRGCGLYLTALLRPQLPPIEVVDFTAWVAVAVCDGIQAACGVRPRIKWTNDIYVGDRKLVGILIEHNHAGASLSRTIAGIGINVNQTAFDPALPNPVSLAQAGAASSTAAGCSKPFWSAACGVTPSSNGAKRRPSSTPTANECTGWANSTPTGCPTARCFRPRSKACFPPAN